MKRFLLLFSVLMLSCIALWAHGVEIGGIYYNLNETQKTAEVTYRGDHYYDYDDEYLGSVTIPETITYNSQTYSVTSIGWSAFSDCSGLTSVTIPNSVTSISYEAFRYCSGLKSIIISSDNLSYTSEDGVLFNKDKTILLKYPEGKENTSYIIPNTVTEIGNNAFYSCSGLTSVTIPNSVTSIDYEAFRYCSGLKSIIISSDNLSYTSEDGVLFNKDKTILLKYPEGKENTSYIIPNTVTEIGNGAFYNCSGLTSITIPNSVTSIGNYAFEFCHKLTSVTIPNSVTSIGWRAFEFCSGLTSVTIGNSVTSIGDEAFRYCHKLTSVTIPNSVTSIGNYAFEFCHKLTSVTIPNSVTSIGSGAFYNTGIYNSESNWDNGVLYIDNCLIEAMSDVVKGSYTIKKGTRIIGPSAFEFCSGLTSVTIPNSVTSIGEYAFEYCSGLTSVTIGNSVTSIGEYAFEGCSGLTSVTIPNSVTSIGYGAFSGCYDLTSVIWNAKNYKDIEVYDETPFYNICSSITSFTFGNEVEHIPAYLCYDMENLKEVTIGNSVTSIGQYAFSGCDKLIKVTAYPTTAPNAYESSFEHYNAYLYVPCDVYEDYDLDDVFGNFQYIKCITAEEDEPTSITETLADANITVSGGTISAEADFSIYNTIGQDVTAFNGSLQPGVYLVSIENNIVKVMVH